MPAVPTTSFVFPKIMNLVYSVYFFNSCSVNTFRFPLFYFMNHHFTTTYRSKLNFSCCFLSLPLQKKNKLLLLLLCTVVLCSFYHVPATVLLLLMSIFHFQAPLCLPGRYFSVFTFSPPVVTSWLLSEIFSAHPSGDSQPQFLMISVYLHYQVPVGLLDNFMRRSVLKKKKEKDDVAV